MIFRVSKYMDALKAESRATPEEHDLVHAHYFPDEASARSFIITRAYEAVRHAEKELDREIKRHRKCVKKFGSKLPK